METRTTSCSVSGVGGVPKRALTAYRSLPNLAVVVGTPKSASVTVSARAASHEQVVGSQINRYPDGNASVLRRHRDVTLDGAQVAPKDGAVAERAHEKAVAASRCDPFRPESIWQQNRHIHRDFLLADDQPGAV